MKSFYALTALMAMGVSALPDKVVRAPAVQEPSSAPKPMIPVVQGCFSSFGDLEFNSAPDFMSKDKCGKTICQALGKKVAATTQGQKCYCGDSYPPKSSLADDKMCNVTCTGFGEACGGLGYYTVYNTGVELVDVKYAPDPSSTSSDSSKPTAATTSSVPPTVFVTESNTPTPESDKNKSKPNTAGIAAGVVVGVVVIGAAVGGIFFVMRRRRNREIEEEHRRNAAVNAFMNSGKPPGSSGGYSASDSRMDPVMAQRRMSSGSIADNEDYSRRILRVTNA